MALIATGICYKIFLYDYQEVYEAGGNYRRMLGGSSSSYGEDYDSDYMEKKQQFTAHLFSGSIATVLICTDLMVLLHQGKQAILSQARTIPKARLALLVFLKYSLLFFLAMMSTFQNDPHFMATFGFAAILVQEFLRRSFHAWQQQEVTVNNADDSSTDSDTTMRTNGTGYYSDDDDYEYEIQNFADAKFALAKFEQQLVIEVKHPSSKGDKGADKMVSHSYYAC